MKKKLLLALAAVASMALCAWALSEPIEVTGSTNVYDTINMGVIKEGGTDHQYDILIYNNGDKDFTLESMIMLNGERTCNFGFDMGKVSDDWVGSSARTGTFFVNEGISTATSVSLTSVKHPLNVYGPGKLALGGIGRWQGTTTIAYDYLISHDALNNYFSLTSRDGYLKILNSNALPTWNPVVLNIPSPDVLNAPMARSVLDMNGHELSIRDLVNSYDNTMGIIHDAVDYDFDEYYYKRTSRPSKGLEGVINLGNNGKLNLQSSKNGARDKINDLGRIVGKGDVQLLNVLTANAPTVYDIVSKEPGYSANPLNNMGNQGTVRFVFGRNEQDYSKNVNDQVTLRINDASPDLGTDYWVSGITGGYYNSDLLYTGDYTLDLSGMQYTDDVAVTRISSPDRFIVDTERDEHFYGNFVFPDPATNGSKYVSADIWEPNFVKTGGSTQTVTDRIFQTGAVFKVSTMLNMEDRLGYIKDSAWGSGIGETYDIGADSKEWPSNKLEFLLTKDVDFSLMPNPGRPQFLPGVGVIEFSSPSRRTINLDMMMDAEGNDEDNDRTNRNDWPTLRADTSFDVDYNTLLPFENVNVYVRAGATVQNAIFGKKMISPDLDGFNEIEAEHSATAIGGVMLDPELELLGKTPTAASPYQKHFAFRGVSDITARLYLEKAGNDVGTVILTPWSWSNLATLEGEGHLVMDSPATIGYTHTNPTYTFLRVTCGAAPFGVDSIDNVPDKFKNDWSKNGKLKVKVTDQYKRAVLMLGVDQGKEVAYVGGRPGAAAGTTGWRTRFFTLCEPFEASIKKIIVSRGAALAVENQLNKELDASVAFYSSYTSDEEPATYRVNTQKGGGSSCISLKDGNEFTFTDPVDALSSDFEGSIKLEFAGAANKDDEFLILRGQNASDGMYRFVYNTFEWELLVKPDDATGTMNRNLYAKSKVDRNVPEIIGLGQVGKNTWTMAEANAKLSLGILLKNDPDAGGIFGYKCDEDENGTLPAGMSFNKANGVLTFKKVNLTEPFEVTLYAENYYGWSAPYTVHFVIEDNGSSVVPTTPTDSSMVTVSGDNAPSSLNAGDAINVTYTIDPTVYDVDTLALHATPSGAVSINWLDKANGVFAVTGTMPSSGNLSWYFTADRLDGTGTYQSPTTSITLNGGSTPVTPSSDDDGGSSGCDAGFAGLALLALAPVFLRKKED